MKTRYSRSPWIDTIPVARRPAYPRLHGEHVADVAIIGGGLIGCATAYACAVAGLRSIVIEADRVGQGSSGRSAGLLTGEPGPSFKDLSAAHGLRAARNVFELWRRGAREGAALLRRLAIRCDLEPLEAWTIALGNAQPLRREFDARTAAGLDARWPPSKQAQRTIGLEVTGGMRLTDGFVVDPYRACLGLAAAAVKRRAQIFERAPVTSVRQGRSGVEITVARTAIVRAATVVLATGVPTAQFKPLRRHFTDRHAYQVLTEVLPLPTRRELGPRSGSFCDTQSPRHRVRWTSDHRIFIAGADQDEPPERTRDAVVIQRTGQLMYELLTMFPAIAGLKPAYGWDRSYGETVDGLMYVGPHRNYPRHLFALGASGDSIAGAFVAANLLVRHLRDDARKEDAVLGWTR
jgi:glycine/D-amino acid oxidase-like deaminating enzyme